jgi:hypothetical protein
MREGFSPAHDMVGEGWGDLESRRLSMIWPCDGHQPAAFSVEHPPINKRLEIAYNNTG